MSKVYRKADLQFGKRFVFTTGLGGPQQLYLKQELGNLVPGSSDLRPGIKEDQKRKCLETGH